MSSKQNNESAPSDATPRCTIIIPTRDKLGYLRTCVDGVLASTDSSQVEILIIDNDSREPATLDYLKALASEPNCRVLQWSAPFNYSAINNYAVAQCHSALVCFLNNDIEISDPDWLHKLVPLAERDDVGAVGCLLCFPDGTIQHAGIELDEFSLARHVGLREEPGRLPGRAPYPVAAVTAACLLMRRDLFQRLGGFNADHLAVAFNDVDLCLRLGDKGLPVLLHPDVSLVHHESVSRQSDILPSNRTRARREHDYMKFRWQHRLLGERASQSLDDYFESHSAPATGSLEETITAATARLYREKESGAALPLTLSEAPSNSGTDSFWHDQYQKLERSYQSLRAHVERVEMAHQMIEQSAFWRMTEPLRRLRDRLRGRRGIEHAKNHDTGSGDKRPEPPIRGGEDIKQAYDQLAESQLKEFLESDQALDFTPAQAPRISILLILYNRAALSLLCLRSLLSERQVPFELIVVDNASTDATDALLTRIEGARVIRNPDNVGFVLAVNQGAKLAQGEYLLLLNNDAVLEADALANALAAMEDDPTIGALGGKIKLLDGTLQEAGSIIFNDGACLGYGRGRRPEEPEFMYRRDVDYCSGAFLLLRRQQFLELGGFDEDFVPAYYEESDYCIRLWQQGFRVVYEPSCQIVHYEFASSGGIKGATALQARNRDKLCHKHPDYLASKFANNPSNALLARTANANPKVLVIDDRVPHPSLGAGYPRCAHVLEVLGELALNVTFYPLLYPNEDWGAVYGTLPANVEVIVGRGEAGLREFLKERKDFYDVIMISRLHNMEVFKRLSEREPELAAAARIIYDAEAVAAPREAMRLRLLGGDVSEQAEAEMIRQELELARPADQVIAVSAGEATLFNRFGFLNTSVLGHVIQPAARPAEFGRRDGLLFVGALRDDGSPNVDSLLWFIINVLPLVESAIPGMRMTVVGDNAAPSLAAIENDSVEFAGRLENIDSLYASHRVFIAPTRFAAGIPHKVHEAAGKGIPSVVTSVLARQLGWQDGQQVVVGDTARHFADACIRLYQDDSLWWSVQRNGLEAVARDCAEAAFRQTLADLFSPPSPPPPSAAG